MADANTPRIEPRKEGPLIVRELDDLRGSDGSSVECKSVMALYHCDASKSNPFCDGSHLKTDWTGSLA